MTNQIIRDILNSVKYSEKGGIADQEAEAAIQELINTSYAQGIQDALFNPQDHTPEEIAERNARIGSNI
jgi:hypothetical protein